MSGFTEENTSLVVSIMNKMNSLRTATEEANALQGQCPHAQDWTLHCCCNSVQIQVIAAICVYTVVIFFLWDFQILLPFKLVVVAMHEFSHACAAWLTCGRVDAIEVHGNEGGVTKTRGGNRFCILSAGYLGSSFWGMIFVIASADYYGVQAVAGLLGLALIISLFLARNKTLVFLTIFFILLIAGFWACTLLTDFNGLRFIILLIGVMSGFFSIYDVYSDLLARRVNESDATMLANHTHTSSRCWGFIWAIISLFFMAVGIYLSLVVGSDPNET